MPKVTKRKNQKTPMVLTRLGRLPQIGVNEWGKALVACPQCGAPAVVDATREIWCRACGYTSQGLVGCG